jgi:4-aminobutyrate aminotransferase-like enzyme
VLLLAGGADGRVAQLLPPLVITDRQLDHGLAVLAAAGE